MGNRQCRHGVPEVPAAVPPRSPIGTRSRRAAERLAAHSATPVETRLGALRRRNAGECPICLGPLEPRAAWVRPALCGHLFHFECLLQWSMVENTCPVCRVWFNHIVGTSRPIAVPDAVQVDDDDD